MNQEDICQELNQIAIHELQQLEQSLPGDPISCFVLFTEMNRVSDYYGIGTNYNLDNKRVVTQTVDIMKMGWNLAASYLLKPLDLTGFPFVESTEITRRHAGGLLYKFGCHNLLKRTQDMIRAGFLLAEKNETGYVFRKSTIPDSQFPDLLEFTLLENLQTEIKASVGKTYAGWNVVNQNTIVENLSRVNNFLFHDDKTDLSAYALVDIESVMTPLIKPWNSAHGIMLSYDSTPEVDNHFLALATRLVLKWRDEAGLHPDIQLGKISSRELTSIVIIVVSLHLKHFHFASIASQKYPEILIPQSLTIWDPLDKLIQDISEFSGMNPTIVSHVFEMLVLKPIDTPFLKTNTSGFVPLLADMGNGYVLRPGSGVYINPFFFILSLLEHRNPNVRHAISSPREDWLRNDLNALFQGVRYQRVEGNIKIREGNVVVTDIDAAIYDNLTGELALFQIKWQDYFFNDVKKLRSKASNLTKNLDEWAEKVTQWIKKNGTTKLTHDLGIRVVPEKNTSIYLFGISRSLARMKGYGFRTHNENLAIANWPQFIRNRSNIGPAPRVFHTLFETLRNQEDEQVKSKPMPIEIIVSDKVMRYNDFWSSIED